MVSGVRRAGKQGRWFFLLHLLRLVGLIVFMNDFFRIDRRKKSELQLQCINDYIDRIAEKHTDCHWIDAPLTKLRAIERKLDNMGRKERIERKMNASVNKI